MRIVIGYDCSPESEYVLAGLQYAGFPPDSTFRIVASTELEPLPLELPSESGLIPARASHNLRTGSHADFPSRSYLENMVVQARRYAADREDHVESATMAAVDRVQRLFPLAALQYEIVDQPAAQAIISSAIEANSDLIVVGSHGKPAIQRLFLGSVSQFVLNHAPCSVRICRPHRHIAGGARLLVGFDASSNAHAAINAVSSRTWPSQTNLRVVTVGELRSIEFLTRRVHHLAPSDIAPEEDENALSIWMTNVADQACQQARHAGLTAEPFGYAGEATKLLLEHIHDWQPDCVFLGATGQRDHRHPKALGSVARALANRAHYSVEIVRMSSAP